MLYLLPSPNWETPSDDAIVTSPFAIPCHVRLLPVRSRNFLDGDLGCNVTGWPRAAGKNVSDFGAALTEAVVTNNTLELADGTVFLGEAKLGSKLFIRPCYKELSELVLDGASSGTFCDIVVTGTSGIGKSVFGLYLLYLLRCQGKTVVFEIKGRWYRFSDTGVEEGSFRGFIDAGYLSDDSNDWYLSDPQDSPYELFAGTSVVLVSPDRRRTHQFLKTGGPQWFMPVWGEDELLECRLALFPFLPSAAVKEAFLVVGGVARAVFGRKEMELHKREIEGAAGDVGLGMMRWLFREKSCTISTDAVDDLLFHIAPLPGTGFKFYSVVFASDYARNSIAKAFPEQEERALAGFVGAAFSNEKLGEQIGRNIKRIGFGQIAHNIISRAGADERRFDMIILGESVEGLLNGRQLSFDFDETGIFKGSAFPDTFVSGKYYRYVPEGQTFPAIDSFGVNVAGDTLYFFQMKSAGIKRDINGTTVKEHWKTVHRFEDVSIKRCVFVYVVPAGPAWEEATKLGNDRFWQKDTNDFVCDVFVIRMPLPGC